MTKSNDLQNELVPLTETIYEIHKAIRIVEICNEDHSLDTYRDVLLLLLRVADRKMYYYEQKYKLNVPDKDKFFVEDAVEFGMAYAEHKQSRVAA